MKKWLYVLTLILFASSVVGLELCQNPEDLNSPCVMLTPTLNCSNFTYSISELDNTSLIVNDSLTTFNTVENIYQFNFTFGSGGYIVVLCDGSTREIQVKKDEIKGELNMIAIVFVFIILIMFFTLMGFANTFFMMRFANFALAFLELVFMVGILFVNESGGSLTGLFKINFYIMAFIGFALVIIGLSTNSIRLMTFEEPGEGDVPKSDWETRPKW